LSAPAPAPAPPHQATLQPPAAAAAPLSPFGRDLRRIAELAWPVFIGQLAVLAFSTVDTVLVARHSATDLAALAVGSAAYITVFIGLMGVVMALGPIVGQLFGAGKLAEAGHQVHQAVWLALVLALLGGLLLVFPTPFLALSRVDSSVEPRVRGYLLGLAVALPAALLFAAYRGFNIAVSRPKAVMVLQLAGLAAKVPLSVALAWGLPALGVPALGVVGCGIATAIAMWAQVFAAAALLSKHPFYTPFRVPMTAGTGGLHPPDFKALRAQLRLGIPMGLAILVEVTGFSFMAIFIARLGTTPVAGHQIAANLAGLLFMMPLSLSHATSTLVAQRIGARDLSDARRLGWRGLRIALAIALAMGGSVFLARDGVVGLYTSDPVVAAAALPLVAWLLWFHVADAAQIMSAFVLRAHRIATVPLIIYATAIWGVGLGGGYAIAFDVGGFAPAALHGARGFWFASTSGLVLAAAALTLFLLWVLKRERGP
jgi:MATE family multidrug resistance protein